MGHSKHINENIYQASTAETEVRHVSAVLRKSGEPASNAHVHFLNNWQKYINFM